MRKSRFTDEQIIAALKKNGAGNTDGERPASTSTMPAAK
jgi:hypothetical protein